MNRLNLLHSRLGRDQNGSVAIMFGFAILVFCVLIGLGIDGGRTIVSRTRTAEALDAATLAATRALMIGGKSDSAITQLAFEYFQKNIANGSPLGVTHDDFHLDINHSTKTVTITVNAHVPTTFAAISGVTTIDYPTSAQATFNVNDIELGLVLDITGSMNNASSGGGGKSKISELKIAAGKMFDILLPDAGSPSDTRIGIAPFSAAVNAGPFAKDVSHGKSKDGCVVERQSTNMWTDADPMPNNEQLEIATNKSVNFDDTEGGAGNHPYYCPKAPVLPLTSDKNALKAEVNGFNAGGYTAGHLGTAWGWYLVSPNWNSIWPAGSVPKPYGTKNLVKAILVMTDGIYNTAYNNNPDFASVQAVALCNNAKAQGVVVYTVGFTAPAGAEATLTACASKDPITGKPNYYHAESQGELEVAFSDIANKLGLLRVSQ